MTKRKRLYISGPYRAKTINEVYNNIAEARRRAEWGWANGFFPICPHLNSAMMDGAVADEVFLECYLQLVDLCHMILMVTGWKESEGSKAELLRAEKSGLIVMSDPLIELPKGVAFDEYIKQINKPDEVTGKVDDNPLRFK